VATIVSGPKKKKKIRKNSQAQIFFFSRAIKIYILIKKLYAQHPWPVGANWTRMALIAHRSFL